jgi:hypothetical protein
MSIVLAGALAQSGQYAEGIAHMEDLKASRSERVKGHNSRRTR